ncbi:MAG: EVE domain-containing protein [Anaerolineae bacterium]|nr:EVE domain-containing protein [Anaerolineae bacterium]
MIGVAGGFAQANHGKAAPLRRMSPGDRVIYYSPALDYGKPEPCQAFTAVGEVVDDEVFAVRMSDDFVPYRRRVRFFPCQEAPIRPLIPSLSFIHDKTRWGAAFRFGMLEISRDDYDLIATRMLG